MKLKDIKGRIRNKVREWNQSQPERNDGVFVPRTAEVAHSVATVANERADARMNAVARYSWIHIGLNRKERRTLDAQLRKGVSTPVKGTKRFKRVRLGGVARKLVKFQLSSTAKNYPARRYTTNNPVYASLAAERGVRVVQG